MPDRAIISAKELQLPEGSRLTSILYVITFTTMNDQGNNKGEEIKKYMIH